MNFLKILLFAMLQLMLKLIFNITVNLNYSEFLELIIDKLLGIYYDY